MPVAFYHVFENHPFGCLLVMDWTLLARASPTYPSNLAAPLFLNCFHPNVRQRVVLKGAGPGIFKWKADCSGAQFSAQHSVLWEEATGVGWAKARKVLTVFWGCSDLQDSALAGEITHWPTSVEK